MNDCFDDKYNGFFFCASDILYRAVSAHGLHIQALCRNNQKYQFLPVMTLAD